MNHFFFVVDSTRFLTFCHYCLVLCSDQCNASTTFQKLPIDYFKFIADFSLRGDAGARVAEGWLGPGEGAHVLEANAMAMAPSLSFKVCP